MNKLIGTISGIKQIEGSVNIPTDNYEKLRNKPTIESIELEGDMSLKDFGIDKITNEEIENILED